MSSYIERITRLERINNFIVKQFPIWRKQFGNNVLGVHVGRKMIKGKEHPKFTIVFQVKKKLKHPKANIPDCYEIETKKGKIEKIATERW